MKKLLTFFLSVFITVSSFAQQTFNHTYISNYVSYSNMWYNNYLEKWEFSENSPREATPYKWEITLNENGGGSLISGTVFYTVKSWEIRTLDDGGKIVVLTALNHTLNREMSIIVSTPENKFFMAVYDYQGLKSYYFME